MREGRFSRGNGSGGRNGGRSGGGQRRGTDNGQRRGNAGSRNGGGRGGFNSRGGNSGNRRFPRQESYEGGNSRERIAVESGSLLLIDQFMLSNSDLIAEYSEIIDEAPETKNALLKKYGGIVVDLEPGTYRIERNPYEFSIIIHPEDDSISSEELKEEDTENMGLVFVDTRCIAMVDRELLDDTGLLKKYQQLWNSGQDKACRDLLRDNGGAVRYGFSRNNDELQVRKIDDRNIIGLWPDVAESNSVEAE